MQDFTGVVWSPRAEKTRDVYALSLIKGWTRSQTNGSAASQQSEVTLGVHDSSRKSSVWLIKDLD